jgi:hypothetical protein
MGLSGSFIAQLLKQRNTTSGGSTSGGNGSSSAPSGGSSSSPGSNPGGLGSQSIVKWSSGAGYRQADILPAAFMSLGDFLIFWEINSPSTMVPYSLNGVSPTTALCALANVGQSTTVQGMVVNPTKGILYMAPSLTKSCWYYLQDWFGVSAGLSVGPAATNFLLGNPQYIAISPTGPGGSILLCMPNLVMANLTQL